MNQSDGSGFTIGEPVPRPAAPAEPGRASRAIPSATGSPAPSLTISRRVNRARQSSSSERLARYDPSSPFTTPLSPHVQDCTTRTLRAPRACHPGSRST